MEEDQDDDEDQSGRDDYNEEIEDDASMGGSSDQSDPEPSDNEEFSEEEVKGIKKRVTKFLTKQEIAANRALRIKMGKSGVHAASRRPSKQGKEACQRKLWN